MKKRDLQAEYLKRKPLVYKQTNFKIGDIVKWTSHSPRNRTDKEGIIVAIVEPKEVPQTVFKDWHLYHLSGSYRIPKHLRSYLIRVAVTKGIKDKLYFPHSSLLTKVRVK